MRVLFLDESGDHNLTVIDDNYPVFVLGRVIVDKDYADGPLTEAFDDFKARLFGRTDLVLHTADIVRNRNGFGGLKDTGFRNRFYKDDWQTIGKFSKRNSGVARMDIRITTGCSFFPYSKASPRYAEADLVPPTPGRGERLTLRSCQLTLLSYGGHLHVNPLKITAIASSSLP